MYIILTEVQPSKNGWKIQTAGYNVVSTVYECVGCLFTIVSGQKWTLNSQKSAQNQWLHFMFSFIRTSLLYSF